jgi:hypothetical protein
MPLPSLFDSANNARVWSVPRAAAYGAGIGAVAALFKAFGPVHGAGSAAAHVVEIGAAALAFALICAGAAALRNFLARRFIRPDLR